MKRPPHILILEDEPDQILLMERGIESDTTFIDHRLSTCERVDEARSLIAADVPDIVFADFNLADGNVLDFLESLPQPIPFPVVVLTAQGDEERAVAVMKAGALDYVAKSPELFKTLPQVARRSLEAWEHVLQRRRAEEALRESEARLQDFFDSATDLIQSVSPEGKFLFTNRAWRETLGYSEEELAGLNIFELIHPSCAEHCGKAFERLMRGEDVGMIEVAFTTKGGDRVDAEGHVNVRFEDGRPVNTRGIFRDVTEKKRTERALESARDRAQRYLDTVQTIMVSLDQDGCIVMINRHGCELLGYRQDELLGANWTEKCIPPAVVDEVLEVFRQIWQGDLAPAEYFENAVLCRDGQERLIAWHNAVLRDDDGNITGTLSSGEDITERKRAEEELRRFNEQLEQMVQERSQALKESEQRFRAIFANSVDGILVVGGGKVLMANRGFSRLLGAPDDGTEIEGREIVEFTPPEFRPTFTRCLQDLVAGHVPLARLELPLQRPDASRLTAEFHASRFEIGDEPCALVICRDITERREDEQRTLRSQRMESIGTLAGGVAHDLNNTLSPILMGVEMLRADCPPESLEDIELIEGSARRGAEMVRQLLNFAKGAKGERVSLNLRPLIREIEHFVGSTIDKTINIKTRFGAGLANIIGDGTQIHQLLLNLCVNSRDAMPDGGVLTISAENEEVTERLDRCTPDSVEGHFVRLSVTDTGMGIPAELMERIFDPFFTTKEEDEGTGLGLATVVGIVKGHGGFLRVESEIGNGTRFYVYLPISGDAADEGGSTAPAQVVDGKGRLVLVAEDEAPNRKLLTRMLKRMKFEVLVAENGHVASELFAEKKSSICLVLTDIRMPVADGLTLIRNVRERSPDLPIVAMTGLYDRENVDRIHELGIETILTKPFTKQALAEALREKLESVP